MPSKQGSSDEASNRVELPLFHDPIKRHNTFQPPRPGLEALASLQSFVWRSVASVHAWLRRWTRRCILQILQRMYFHASLSQNTLLIQATKQCGSVASLRLPVPGCRHHHLSRLRQKGTARWIEHSCEKSLRPGRPQPSL